MDLLLVHLREHFEHQFHLQLAQSQQYHLSLQLSIHHLIQCHQIVEEQFFEFFYFSTSSYTSHKLNHSSYEL